MSSTASDKQAKGKSKKAHVSKTSKSTNKGGRDANANVDRFRGDGINFKCKLLGVAEVDGPRGDNMCIEAIKKLKVHQRQSGEHKMKIILNVTLMGIRILEEKTKGIMFEHPVNKVSFITHDPDDKKIFSFISSAKCSAGSVGHMMYAIKYDKIAGIITSTLYDLFQAVFKLRQDAALKQRKAQQREPQTPTQYSNLPANSSVVSNGPSEASTDSNIYEEPSASSSELKSDSESAHYQVPVSRPLPPAPYASQGKPAVSENNGDPVSSQAISSSSEHFFSTSVFTQADHTDNASESSLDMTRKGSISSSVSSTSETASFDTRSLEFKPIAASSTPPSIPHARNSTTSSSPAGQTQVGHTLELKSNPEPDYETINSDDYETIPSDLVCKSEKTEKKPAFGEFNFKETFGDDQTFPFDAEKASNGNVDPFASEPSLKKSDGSPPSSAVFGNDDFFSSHFEDKHVPTTAFPTDDPFAPMSGNDCKESKSTDHFASSDAFEAAFGGSEMSPDPFGTEKDNEEKDKKCSESPKSEAFSSPDKFDTAFGRNETSSDLFGPEICQNQSQEDKSDSSKSEAFTSSDVFSASFGGVDGSPDPFGSEKTQEQSQDHHEKDSPTDTSNAEFGTTNMFKPTENKDIDQKALNTEPHKELSWGDAFGGQKVEDQSNDKADWATAFEDNDSPNHRDGKGTKDNKKEVSFSFDDSFGTKVDNDELDKGHQPDSAAAEPEISWNDAFNDKSQKEVTFSWDDAFGGPTDSKDGQKDSDSNAFSFSDAFSSTPFKPQAMGEPSVDINGALPLASFGDIQSPLTPSKQENKTDAKMDGENSFEGSMTSQSNISESTEAKPKLADMEDLSKEDKKEDSNKGLKMTLQDGTKNSTIPQIVIPPRDDSIDDQVRPVSLPILATKTTETQESPTAPPPLPPRPTMAPLPSLPPRPRTLSSPVAPGQIPPTPPRPVGSTALSASKSGTPKRLPPALPPRIDLEGGKMRSNSSSVIMTSAISSAGQQSTSNSSEVKTPWQANWPGDTTKDIEKGNVLNSKKSPDPFGDDFFTDFNFSANSENKDSNSNGINQNNEQLFSDPFVGKDGAEDMFKVDFGGEDPFAHFASNNKTVDPFASSGEEVFSGFSTSDDPFLDSVDPFAEKGTIGDPFTSPKRDDKEGSTSLQLNKSGDDGEFADSFA